MFDLKWFPKWNRDNPTDIYGPAIIIGAAFSAVFVAALVISWGYPFATTSDQTGPAGTGMSVVAFASDAEAPDLDVIAYADTTEEPIAPQPGDRLAGGVYENVQVLGGLTEDNFNRLMLAITEWVSPEQGCAYCHADGESLASDSLYTKVVARRMIQMTQHINEAYDGHVGPAGVNCYTCHRGQNVPNGVWFNITPVQESVSGWAAVQNFATSQNVSTSLPSDALETLLLGDGEIAVHDLEPRVPNEGTATWQDTERTYSLMNYFSSSLGVNCVFCHNSRAFYDPEQVTPQWARAFLGISMVRELNVDYLVPLRDAYPENRLGPVHADAPKAACLTCHQGAQQPLNGTDMISDWPELAGSGPPSYE